MRCDVFVLLAFACLTNFSTSGIIYGWQSMVQMLARAGVYSELCGGGHCGRLHRGRLQCNHRQRYQPQQAANLSAAQVARVQAQLMTLREQLSRLVWAGRS